MHKSTKNKMVLRMLIPSDLLPILCYPNKMFGSNQSTCNAMRTALSLGCTNKSYNQNISSYKFWHNLTSRIGTHNSFFDEFPLENKGKWLEFVKHQFCQITHLMKQPPSFKSNSIPLFSYPLVCNSGLKILELNLEVQPDPQIEIYALDQKSAQKDKLTFPKEDSFVPFWMGKPYLCLARSEDYIVINGGYSKIFIFSAKDHEIVKKLDFKDGSQQIYEELCQGEVKNEGIDWKKMNQINGILQIEIRCNHLYVRRNDQKTQKLTIFNLKALEDSPVEITLPMASSNLLMDHQNSFCFGKTHLIGYLKQENDYKLYSASYHTLQNFSASKKINSPWLEETIANFPYLFAQGNNFVAVTQDSESNAYDITEIFISEENYFFHPLSKNLSVLPDKSCFHSSLLYSNGHLTVAYFKEGKKNISVYNIESQSRGLFSVEDVSIWGWTPYPNGMVLSTAFKIHYFKTSMTPFLKHVEPRQDGSAGTEWITDLITLNFGLD